MESDNYVIALKQSVFGVFDAVSLVAAIASLVLAVVAIWLSISFKRDADIVNRETSNLLLEVKSDSKAISQGVMSELKAYGEAMRGNMATENTYKGGAQGITVAGNESERTT